MVSRQPRYCVSYLIVGSLQFVTVKSHSHPAGHLTFSPLIHPKRANKNQPIFIPRFLFPSTLFSFLFFSSCLA